MHSVANRSHASPSGGAPSVANSQRIWARAGMSSGIADRRCMMFSAGKARTGACLPGRTGPHAFPITGDRYRTGCRIQPSQECSTK
jgi:hypothetical protein